MILNDLALFTAVANHLSFSKAAKQLGIPLSRVSRRITHLEEHMGVQLFQRTTRQVRLTEEGRSLLDRCQAPIEALQDLAGFADDTRTQTIRITAPPLAARTTVGRRLLEFAALQPEVKIELTTSYAYLDFLRDNIDLAFRLGPLTDSSLVARRLWPVPYCFCVGRRFANAHNLSRTITVKRLKSLPAIRSRQPWLLESGDEVRPTQAVHMFDDLELVLQAVRQDLGVAMLPADLLSKDVQPIALAGSNALQRDMYAVHPRRRLLAARVRHLIDFMASRGSD